MSELEETFAVQLAALQIMGDRQWAREVAIIPGRRFRFDFVNEIARLAVEIQGGTWAGGAHVRGGRYRTDCEKMILAQLAGWRVFYLTGDMVKDGTGVAFVERALKGENDGC